VEREISRKLTYRLSFDRMNEVGLSSIRKISGNLRWARPLLIAVYFLFLAVNVFFFNEIFFGWVNAGLPFMGLLLLVVSFVIFVLGLLAIERARRRRLRERVDLEKPTRLTQDDGGLRFATDQIEHYLKWHGITEMWLEPDGVVVSSAALAMLIPNTAFSDAAARLAFIRDVYARLSEQAKSRSERDMQIALNEA
jgi:hypothetical protein